MFHLDLDEVTRDAFWEAILDSHQIDVDVGIHDPHGERVGSFTLPDGQSLIEGGSVQVDTTQDVSRSLELEAVDPLGTLAFEPDSPKHGGIYMGYFVSAHYEVFVERFGSWPSPLSFPSPHAFPGHAPASATDGIWVRCPVFFGPLSTFEQTGPEIKIGAKGMEARGLAPFYATRPYNLPKHMLVDNAIVEVLDRAGFWRLDIPSLPYRIKTDRPVHPQDEPWKVVAGGGQDSQGKDVAGLIERTGAHPHHIYNDATGHTRIKRLNKEPVFTFEESMLTTRASWDFSAEGFYNAVDVTGSRAKGKGKKRAHALVELPADHPMSPESLRTPNGRKVYLTRFETVPSLKTDHDCRQRGRHLLRHSPLAGVQISFDSIVVPTLEELDVIVVQTKEFSLRFPLRQFTLPLASDSDMTIGDTKRVRRKKGSHKHRHGGGGPHHHRHHHHHHGGGGTGGRHHGGRHHHHHHRRH